MDGPIDGPLLPWPVGPPPGPGLHQWDGQGAGPIRLIEVMMEAEIERLDGIQNIRNMVHAAWVRLSTAVGPANGYVNITASSCTKTLPHSAVLYTRIR